MGWSLQDLDNSRSAPTGIKKSKAAFKVGKYNTPNYTYVSGASIGIEANFFTDEMLKFCRNFLLSCHSGVTQKTITLATQGFTARILFLFWAPSLEKAALVAAFLILGHESFPMKKISGFRLFYWEYSFLKSHRFSGNKAYATMLADLWTGLSRA